MDAINAIALTLGIAWASGINLYAAVLTLGILGMTGNIVLPASLKVLANPEIITLAVFLYVVEFIADKIPGFDSFWDAIHTFIRIPAGAALAAGAIGTVNPVVVTMAVLAGGLTCAGSHGMKMSTRLAINASPEPFTNWAASVFEDIIVVIGVYTALHHPLFFLLMLVVFIALMIWLIPKLFCVIKSAFMRIRGFLKNRKS